MLLVQCTVTQKMLRKRGPFWAIFRHGSISLSLIGQRYDPWALQHLLFSSCSSQSTSWRPRRVVVTFCLSFPAVRLFFAPFLRRYFLTGRQWRLTRSTGLTDRVFVLLMVRKASALRTVLLTVVSWWHDQLISVVVNKTRYALRVESDTYFKRNVYVLYHGCLSVFVSFFPS